MIKLENIVKKFNDKVVIDKLNLEIHKGEIVALIGKNGAGKSTLFRILLNVLEYEEGTIKKDNKKQISYLPEEGSLNLQYTVWEQALYYGKMQYLEEEIIKERLIKYLEYFGILEYFHKKQKELSKGNRQRIQFIISLLSDSEYYIFDEPFSGLDPLAVDAFINIIKELKESKKGIIFSSHQMANIERIADKICIIDKGNVLAYGTLQQIKEMYDKQDLQEIFVNLLK